MDEKIFYLELVLNLVFEVPEDKKEALLIKVNECIEKLIRDEKSIQFNSTIDVVSEEQLFAALSGGIMSDEYN